MSDNVFKIQSTSMEKIMEMLEDDTWDDADTALLVVSRHEKDGRKTHVYYSSNDVVYVLYCIEAAKSRIFGMMERKGEE